MRKMRGLFAAMVLLAAGTGAVAGPTELYDRCFARTYDEAHLAAHSGQDVTAINIWLTDFEDDLFAGISLTKRGSDDPFVYSGTCFRAVAGGFSCDGCKGDSCEWNGETFRILVRGEDGIDFVVDETGVTTMHYDGEAGTEAPYKLGPGGEHGVLTLSAAPESACGE